MFWLGYLRAATAAAVRAGIHDGLTSAVGPSDLNSEQAERALLDLVTRASGSDDHEAAPARPTQSQLNSATPNGPPAIGQGQKKGPGRPRKFQEPPDPDPE